MHEHAVGPLHLSARLKNRPKCCNTSRANGFACLGCLKFCFKQAHPPQHETFCPTHELTNVIQREQDPMTLGAMSEDAWKEVRLPLGLKEKLGSLNTAENTAFLRTPSMEPVCQCTHYHSLSVNSKQISRSIILSPLLLHHLDIDFSCNMATCYDPICPTLYSL